MVKCIYLLLAPVSWSLTLAYGVRCPDGVECNNSIGTYQTKRGQAGADQRRLPMFGAIWQNNVGKREGALPLFSGVLPRRSTKRQAVVRRSSIPLFSRVLQFKPSKRESPVRRSSSFPMFSGLLHFKQSKRAQDLYDQRHIPLFSGVFQQRGYNVLRDNVGKRSLLPSFSMILRKKNMGGRFENRRTNPMIGKRQYFEDADTEAGDEADLHSWSRFEDPSLAPEVREDGSLLYPLHPQFQQGLTEQ